MKQKSRLLDVYKANVYIATGKNINNMMGKFKRETGKLKKKKIRIDFFF